MKPIDTYVISDLHFGHKRIAEFRPQFESMLQHEEYICDLWQDTVKSPNDKVWVLGDAAFNLDGLTKIGALRGRKFLVRGNHDTCSTKEYLAVFEEIYGLFNHKKSGYEKAWLSHAPIHPDELRGAINLHGHVHNETVYAWYGVDYRYVNCCPENIGYAPVLMRTLIPKKTK